MTEQTEAPQRALDEAARLGTIESYLMEAIKYGRDCHDQ